MLELKKINKSFQIREDKYQHVLKDLSVTFPSSGFVTLLGASGNGKTTVLNIIGGLDQPDSGEIYFNKEKIEDFESFRREKVSFIFQDLNLIPHLNALDNVILGISDETSHKKEKAKEILLSLGLEESLYKRPDQLSGGQQQRVAIARTIAKNVDIIICDEPTGSLDNETKKIITDILKELSKEKLVIFITHNLDLANLYSDLIFETVDGRIVNHSHLIKQGQFDKSENERMYDSNVVWLAFKNIMGRYKHTIRYALFIVFIMLIASTAIVIQGEYVKKYIHDISLDTGIKSIRVDYQGPKHSMENLDLLKEKENVESIALIYNTQIRLTTGRMYEPPKLISTDLVQMTDKAYFEGLLLAGQIPEKDDEVLMTANSVINMLTKLGIGGQRLKDQYATGELDAKEVFDLIDLSSFTVFETGWPKFKIVGIIDDSKIYEKDTTLYMRKGFTKLFDYSATGRPSYLELPKHLELSKIIIYKDNVYRESHDQLLSLLEDDGYRLDASHEKRIHATYNKIDSFFSLSVVFLYVIIAIASISFVSLLSASIFERKYEIGLYRTKGYTKLNIMKILGLEMYFLGFISLIVSIIILLVTAFVMYVRIDYITSISHVFRIINIPLLSLALLGIVTLFVVIIVYISNTIILRESVLSNIKDTGHNKKTIRKQVVLVLLLLSLLGIAQVSNKKFEFMAFFTSEAIEAPTYKNRDDFSNVDKTGLFEVFSKEALESDFDYLTGKIYVHTHLNTDYNAFKAYHEYAKENIFDEMTKLEYMRLIKPLVASLNCVNTDLSFTDDLDQVKVFADKVYALDGKIYLQDNTFYKDIAKGSQITSINGREVSEILESIFAGISSEGDNNTYKYFVLNRDFARHYLTSVEYAEEFEITYISPDGTSEKATAPGLLYKDMNKASDRAPYASTFTDTYGLLTLKSFMPLDEEKCTAFIDDFFKTLKDRDLSYLILDLRGNLGGHVSMASHLLSYLQEEPGQFLGSDIKLAKNHYKGKVYILQDGGSSSMTGQVLSVLKDQDRAYHIGDKTSSGSMISSDVKSSQLTHTNIMLSIATQRTIAETSVVTKGQGLMPDYVMIPDIDHMTSDQDVVMDFANHIVSRDLAIDDFSKMESQGLFETYTRKELREDLIHFKKLTDLHSHLFTDEALLEELLSLAEDKLFDGMTKLEFMRVLQPIAATLNAHNTVVFSDDDLNDVKLFADQVYAQGDKLYLSDNKFYDIPLGSQILSINGRQASDIIDLISSSLSSDGDNTTYKYHLINKDFGGHYFRFVEYMDYFDIEYLSPQGQRALISVPSVQAQTIADKYQLQKDILIHQTFTDDYAILTVRAFSPLIKEPLDDFFKSLDEHKLKYLILDLRGNTGGDTEASDQLASYLVPDHPLRPDYAFDGQVHVLQDGGLTAITSQFLAKLRSERVGTSFGDEAGSSSVISTSVESTELENTNLIFNYSTLVSDLDIPEDTPERGIMPDIEVNRNLEDLVSKKDTQLAYVKDILEKKIHYGEFYNMSMEGLFEVYKKEDLTKDLDMIVATLKDYHTNLYTDQALFDQLEGSVRNSLHDDMTKLEFLRLTSPLVSSVNCWQTSLSYSVVNQAAKNMGGAYSRDVFDSNIKVFADKIHIYKDKLYLYDNTFYELPLASEILSINGRSSSEIIKRLLDFIPSDGDNQTIKYDILNTNFSWYYFLYLENTDKFTIVYKMPNGSESSKTVYALSLNEISKEDKTIRRPIEPVSFAVYDDYAYLDINTFDVYEQLQQKNFRYALYDFFMEVDVKETDNVILDLRGNHGGNPVLAAKLLTYLQAAPHRYWHENSADNTPLSSPLETSKINYSGKLYVLIDGGSAATTGHLIALLKYHDIGTFIGQNSASTYISSDSVKVISLSNTKINLSYSSEIFEVDAPGLEAGKGIQPDYEIVPSLYDMINGQDPVLDFARGLMNQ